MSRVGFCKRPRGLIYPTCQKMKVSSCDWLIGSINFPGQASSGSRTQPGTDFLNSFRSPGGKRSDLLSSLSPTQNRGNWRHQVTSSPIKRGVGDTDIISGLALRPSRFHPWSIAELSGNAAFVHRFHQDTFCTKPLGAQNQWAYTISKVAIFHLI